MGFNLSIQLLILGIIYLQDLEQNLHKNKISNIGNIAKGSVWNPKSVGKEKKIIRKMIFVMFVFIMKNKKK